MARSFRLAHFLAALPLFVPASAGAWGFEGHRAIALIARDYLTPSVRTKVDAILASDTDPLTAHDMASEATWADAYRSAGHRETAQWHFVDQEVDGSADLKAACFGFPMAGHPASTGPAQDCVVDKVREFSAELAAPDTTPAERLLALKFLLHFVGDLHQPLHASDNHDRGGNCVLLALGGSRTVNLHSYWDTAVVEAIAREPDTVANTLRIRIKPSQATAWQQGDAAAWAQEAFLVARSTAYTIGSPAGCQTDASPITLPTGYEARARDAAAVQLEKAGVRLAAVLNQALATVSVANTTGGPPVDPKVSSASMAPAITGSGRTAESLACSADADAKGLHGKERQRFRRQCMRERRTS